jgi:hypothetical protein
VFGSELRPRRATLHDRALFQFWEQKLPVNGYSNARK